MRLEIVMGLMSSFQIYHQCMSNTLSSMDFSYSTLQLSVISASFPIGKLFGTIGVVYIFRRHSSNRECLDYSACLLIIGAVLLLLPFLLLLCLARFVIGLGVGIAFVSAFVALNDDGRNLANSADRSRAFLGTAALFSTATFLVNASAYFRSMSYLMVVSIFAVPSLLAGLNYFWHRHEYCETRASGVIEDGDGGEDFAQLEDSSSPEVIGVIASIEGTPRAPMSASMKCSPKLLAVILMCINATIGVPIILAFCSIIYRHLGLSHQGSIHLSSIFPLLQLGVIFAFRHWSSRGIHFSNRSLLLAGYAICLVAMFLLLVTARSETLDDQPRSKAMASAFWFTILAVASGIPCNAGVCLIGELFSTKKQLIEGSSLSRAFFWTFSSILSGGFLSILERYSVFLAFAPCFIASLVAYILLVILVPEADEEGKEAKNKESSALRYSSKYGGMEHVQ